MEQVKKNLGVWLALLSQAVLFAAKMVAETIPEEPTRHFVIHVADGLAAILGAAAIFVNPDASPNGLLARLLKKS